MFLWDQDKLILKWEWKGTRIGKTHEKAVEDGRLAIADKTYNVWSLDCGIGTGAEMETTGTELSPETQPQMDSSYKQQRGFDDLWRKDS